MKSKYNKNIIFGAIIILIGASILPTISGHAEKISSKTNNIDQTIFPLNDDYINAYWKFDEGGGNTAYDSSINNYNGIINGAIWATGYSGYALDFDGVNDYIDFDDHAKNFLGFNKTDDLIFSFYFKSTSTNKGIIYSMCRGDAYGYNPGFHIALHSNGSIEVKVWRLNCGILMHTSNSYNDGSWHYVEIFYNGITSNPVVKIYVDNEFDTILEKWVCSFYSDQFKYAQMGRNSHELTDYFDGVIDEFKIIKYPGGNEQNPPSIDGPNNGDPGVEYDFTFVTNDPEEDDVWIHINWGDGNESDWLGPYSSGEEAVVSYEWQENGDYEIIAESKDIWDDSYWSDPHIIYIGNAPPNKPTIDGPKYGEIGETLSYTFVAEDFDGDQVEYYIDWGDDESEWTGLYNSGEEVTVSHSWDSKGDFEITSYAVDSYGREGDLSDPYLLRIGDEAPNAPQINGPTTGVPNTEYTYIIKATDPEGDDILEYTINWGDGTGEEIITGPFNSGEEISVPHTWTKRDTYVIRAKAKDIFEKESAWGTLTVTIPRNRLIKISFLEFLLEQFQQVLTLIQNLWEI